MTAPRLAAEYVLPLRWSADDSRDDLTDYLRRSIIVRSGRYDGDSLFENLELERTVRVAGGQVSDLPGLFIARRPPPCGLRCGCLSAGCARGSPSRTG